MKKLHHRSLWGIHPFWFWNSSIDEQEIIRQIELMAEEEISGFYIHCRQGLDIPYLSSRYFSLVQTAVEHAERKGMKVHIYDEYPYPSGIAGGMVADEDPSFLARELIHIKQTVTGLQDFELPGGRLLICQAYPIENDSLCWNRPIDLKNNVGVKLTEESYMERGLTKLNNKRYFSSVPKPFLHHDFGNEQFLLFCCTEQIVNTHKYWGRYIDTLNKKATETFIRFTHERYKRYLGHYFGTTILSVFTDETTPGWSPRIANYYSKEYGQEMISYLPAVLMPEHPDHHEESVRFSKVQQRLFTESFELPLKQWAQENDLLWGGEKPSISITQLGRMDIPGCEPGHFKAGDTPDLLGALHRQNVKAVSSAAYLHNSPAALCETMHSLGWSATLQDQKVITEALLLLGITTIVPHAYFYSCSSLRKYDAPPSMFYQMPYWHFTKYLSRNIAEIQEKLGNNNPDWDIVILDPGASVQNPDQRHSYKMLMETLVFWGTEFIIADSGSLTALEKEPFLYILPPMDYLDPEMALCIDNLEKNDSSILRMDSLFTDSFQGFLKEQLNGILEKTITITDTDDRYSVWQTRRINEEGKLLWFVLNLSELEHSLLLPESLGGESIVLGPLESRIFTEDMAVPEHHPEETEENNEILSFAIPSTVEVTPKNDNVLRLEQWELSLHGENGEVSLGTVKAMPIINQAAELNAEFAPHISLKFGQPPELQFPPLDLVYSYTFTVDFDGRVFLGYEEDSIKGKWQAAVNNSVIDNFVLSSDKPVPGLRMQEITGDIRQGENEITLNVQADRHDHGLLSPLYITGDFGIDADNSTIRKRRPDGGFEEYNRNGLPYFSGTIRYDFDLSIPEAQNTDIIAAPQFPDEFRECCELSVNGSRPCPMPWKPYTASVPTGTFRKGINQISITVYTSLIRSFEGAYYDTRHKKTVPVV